MKAGYELHNIFWSKILLQNCDTKLMSIWRTNGLIVTLLIALFLRITD